MKRILFASLMAAIISVAMSLPASAASGKPFLGMGVCNHASDNTFYANVDWGNQVPTTGDLTITITFKGPMVGMQTYVTTIPGPIAAESLNNPFYIPQFSGANGPIAWDAWTSVNVSTTGAFTDEWKALHQPHGGWPTCTF